LDCIEDNTSKYSSIFKHRLKSSGQHAQFIKDHPELQEIMSDYVQLVLLKKPEDVFSFT
ncbi:hypothetical protein BDR26DRAFT_794340, partial [Obelidium mucronatum]